MLFPSVNNPLAACRRLPSPPPDTARRYPSSVAAFCLGVGRASRRWSEPRPHPPTCISPHRQPSTSSAVRGPMRQPNPPAACRRLPSPPRHARRPPAVLRLARGVGPCPQGRAGGLPGQSPTRTHTPPAHRPPARHVVSGARADEATAPRRLPTLRSPPPRDHQTTLGGPATCAGFEACQGLVAGRSPVRTSPRLHIDRQPGALSVP